MASSDPEALTAASPAPGWLLPLTGLAATGLAWALALLGAAPLPRVLLIGAGLLALGQALTCRYHRPGCWLLAAAALLCAQGGFDAAWDSARLAARGFALAALLGAWLAWLSPARRLAAVSVLIALHLGGVVVAVASKPNAGGSESWLASKLWTVLYHPYLDFAFLERSYNFYSPEPRPETILWFRITRADGTGEWLRLPDHARCATLLEFSRGMTLVENISTETASEDALADLEEERRAAGEQHDPPIPLAAVDVVHQYQEPTHAAKLFLASLARFVARTHTPADDPGRAVAGVKIYQVVHHLPTPEEFAGGMRGNDPTLYWAYYLGDYRPDGTLTPECETIEYDDEGAVVKHERDPFLYWLLPIERDDDGAVINYVNLHAGDTQAADAP